MKKIPTDVDNFITLREENYYFFDKSGYIRELEAQKKFILLVRPRRMGKTLFSSMLMAYYDINLKNRFHELFGDLDIGENPTEWANQYMVLRFDFSHINNSDIDILEKNFNEYCRAQISEFIRQYDYVFSEDERIEILSMRDLKNSMVHLVSIAHRKKMKVFLSIDEYDNFTNTVLAARGVKAHEAITHGEGFYRTFFSGCKGTFDRINTDPQEQAFLRGLLCNNPYYDVWPEFELNDGFCDLLLVPKAVPENPAKYSYLIELKHMGSKAKSPDAKIKDACKQLRQYISDAHLAHSTLLGNTTLIPLYLVFRNNKLVAKGKI